jgi:NAD(P)-dependent dehydrogenase (short-subunit alcohol dehydrogenase family)
MNRRCQNDLDPKESMKTKAMNTASIEHREEPSPTHDLTGKRVVVVGGKTGIGLGVARAAQAAGATVVVASRRHISAEERPDLALFEQVNLDLRDEASVRAAFEAIGPFDHLHVTAGTEAGSWGAFMDEDMRGVRSYMESKFLGSWACARHAALRQRWVHHLSHGRHRGAREARASRRYLRLLRRGGPIRLPRPGAGPGAGQHELKYR